MTRLVLILALVIGHWAIPARVEVTSDQIQPAS